MNGWHFVMLFVFGSVGTWAGAIACARRRLWAWTAVALVPFGALAVWIFGIWTRLDWDSAFFDQKAWLIAAELVLLAGVWAAGIGAWATARRSPAPRRDHEWRRAG